MVMKLTPSLEETTLHGIDMKCFLLAPQLCAFAKSVRPEVRGTTDFDGGAYPPPKTSPSYALTTLIIFRFGRAGRDR